VPKKSKKAATTARKHAKKRRPAFKSKQVKAASTAKKRVSNRKTTAKSVSAGSTRPRPIAAPVRFAAIAPDPTQQNLQKIEHLVVLVMENRSFDHMLGYLKLETGRTDVDGLVAGMSNAYNGKTYPIRHLQKTAFGKNQDPCHDGDCVTEQLSNNNGGFVTNYAKTHQGDPEVDLVMGHYNGSDLPVYDHLSRNFLICDRWFSSVDGSTWPNRLYAVTGRAAGSKKNKKIPVYSLPSFARYLNNNNVSWRWYAHDISTLRVTDEQFRIGHFKHFSYFDRRSTLGGNSFLEDAAAGKLAAVSWIDPNFVDVGFIGPSGSNDDHPPSDILAGQELVLKLYNAIVSSPQWNKTLLVIVYDEHGGFFDHVAPLPAQDDSPAFRQYGVRVPAFVVSPFVERGKASNSVFDHTSIIKTILLRFCQKADGSIPDMGTRVNQAAHLGSLLTLPTPRPAPPVAAFQHLINRMADWKAQVFKEHMLLQARGLVAAKPKLNELQEGIIKAKAQLRTQGLPPGQP
jgi:phospholipase C